MALPGGITPVTVTGVVADNTGAVATGGTVTFRMPVALCDGTDHEILAPGSWTATINGSGAVNSGPIPATTITGVSPAGWSYDVTIDAQLPGGKRYYKEFHSVLPSSASLEQLLASAAPTPSSPTAYVPLSAVGATVAPLVAGKVPSEFLPPGGGGSGVESVTAGNGTIDVDNADPLNPTVVVGTGIPQASVSSLPSDLSALSSGVAAVGTAAAGAQSTANAAGTAATGAQSTANGAASAASAAQGTANTAVSAAAAAQATANAAYVEPPGGIPETDLALAVRNLLTLAGTAYQEPVGGIPYADLAAAVQAMLAPQIPADLIALGFHACNIPLFAARTVSTIGNETWYARVLVRRGQPINQVAAYRSKSTAAALGAGGLNGFTVWSGDATTLLASTVSDDSMWLPVGKIAKPISGILTPTVDTFYWVAAHVQGYSTAPEFAFQDLSDSPVLSDAGYMARYKGGSLSSWPASFNPDTDLTSGGGFILPLFLGA